MLDTQQESWRAVGFRPLRSSCCGYFASIGKGYFPAVAAPLSRAAGRAVRWWGLPLSLWLPARGVVLAAGVRRSRRAPYTLYTP